MQITQTRNPYSFEPYITERNQLDDLDNPFLLEVFKSFNESNNWAELYNQLKAFSNKSSFKWKKLIEEIARVENHPKLRHFDAYNNRIDRIIRPKEMLELEQDVFSSSLFSDKTSKEERIMKRFLLQHQGEAGVVCPIACTDGLVAILEHFKNDLSPELTKILEHVKEGKNGEYGIGAQFMSEIQGGSNIPANMLEAVPNGNVYRLYGNKFFCSAAHADYSVVTARVKDTEHVAVFIVPTWLEGDKKKEKRNGHVINRLKWKLGTSELPSGEIEYNGAVAYSIGPVERGVSLAVGTVLTLSRLDIGFSSAAFMMRAAREVTLYARFREVFDRKIDEFPMAKAQLNDIVEMAKRTTATAFKIYQDYQRINHSNTSTEKKLEIRVLILLQKIYSSRDTVDTLRTAISIFGGHGAIEDFSSIPRLFRDAMVNELWEGPRNVLLSQIYRDFLKNSSTYSAEEFLTTILPTYETREIKPYQDKLKELLHTSKNLYGKPDEENIRAAREWEQLWSDVFLLYQYQALKELPNNQLGILPENTLKAFEV